MNLPKFLKKSDLLSSDKSDSTLKEALVPTDSEKSSSDHQEILISQAIPLVNPQNVPLSEANTRPGSISSLPYPPNPTLQYGQINYTYYGLNPALQDPNRPLSYHEFFHAGLPGCWRPITGMLGLAAGMMIVAPLFLYALFAYLYSLSGESFEILDDGLENITPGTLAFMNLALASAIPITWFLVQELHGLKPGWVSSVKSRIRWTWLRDCLGLSVLTLLATITVSWLISILVHEEESTESGPKMSEWNDTTRDFLIVILVLTPLQAAGEEYAFRGYLTQAFGGLCSRRWVAVLVPAVLFAMAHGAQAPPLFLDRFAFGIVTGLLVIMTGGLEAGIAMHVLNNLMAFAAALTMNDMGSALKSESVSWWHLPVTLTQSSVYLGLVMMAARKRGIETTVVKSEVQGQNVQMPNFYPAPLPL